MSTNSTAYMRRYRAKMRAQGRCQCGREAVPGKSKCVPCLTYGIDPHQCPRCGEPTKGTGKGRLCKPCATHFSGLRNAMQRWIT